MADFRRPNDRDNKGRIKFRNNDRKPKNNNDNHKSPKKNKEPRFSNCYYCKHKIVFTIETTGPSKGLKVLHLSQNSRRSKKCYESGCKWDRPSTYGKYTRTSIPISPGT